MCSSSGTCMWPYEVFISFRGKDTGTNFTDHLYEVLDQKGVITFRDNEKLEKENSIRGLFKAIQGSRYVIAIISITYADVTESTWCLEELAKAVECKELMGMKLLPIFYHVHPSEIRNKKGSFQKALSEHEQASQANRANVKRWRAALVKVSSLSGWHVEDGYESQLIQTIVRQIFKELNQAIPIVFGDLVGMDSRIEEVVSCLQIGSNKVRIMGIWGMGGIGKTTIARVVSERIKSQFDACIFLANVREVTEKQGIVQLQKQLLSYILLEDIEDIQNLEMGVRILSQRLCTKRVLIVLDDVGHVKQLEALCGQKAWFGAGSRIIITSRDERLFTDHEVDETYQVKALTDDDALCLFFKKSFKGEEVREDFIELSLNFVGYADGSPLAIEVLGLSLFGRSREEWSSALDSLDENPDKTIINVLKVSYDGLQDIEKIVFLDIACFFKGDDKHRVTRILESSYGYRPVLDINVLMEKSLLTPVGRRLWMHDMIQEMGWEIVRRNSPEELGKRSRLWLPNDIKKVLIENMGTPVVQTILLNFPKEEEANLNVNDPFSKLNKLRLLKIRNGNFSGNIKYLSSELALLEWHSCPLNTLPSNYASDKLIELTMHSSCIKRLWKGEKRWNSLVFIDMSNSEYLTKTPDFTKVPNLEKLVLQGCTRLVEVHPSLGLLKKLVVLNMRNCKFIESFLPSIRLESLEILCLSACSRLKEFPEIEGNMKRLLKLYLDGTAIEDLPPSIERLTGLTLLNLGDCNNLLFLPSTIQRLKSLKILILTGCSELHGIPENLNCLEELDMSGTAIRESSFILGMNKLRHLSFQGCKDLPSKPWHTIFNWWWSGKRVRDPLSLVLPTSLSHLTSLTHLNLSDCNLMEGGIPNDFGRLPLQVLDLSGNNFVSLPESLFELSKLRELHLSNSSRLQFLPKKFQYSLLKVIARDCPSLVDLPNQFQVMTTVNSGTTTINSLISSKNKDNVTRKFSTSACPMTGLTIESEHQCDPYAYEYTETAEKILKELEGCIRQSAFHSIVGVGHKIPQWFTNAVFRGSVEIPIPPNLKENKKWMGVAAVFTLKEHDDAASYIESDLEASNYFYKCGLRTNDFRITPYFFRRKQRNFIRSGSHLLCAFYNPCSFFPENLNESSAFVASFETNNPFMVLKEFGIRLLYEQDVTSYLEALLSCYDILKYQEIPSDYCIKQPQVDEATFEAGWATVVNNAIEWEESIPTIEEGSVILARKNMESLLPRYLKRQMSVWEPYIFAVSGSPLWFKPTMGSSVSIQVPLCLGKNKKWMGFALCASLVVDTKESSYDLLCEVTANSFQMNSNRRCENNDKHQLWVLYLSMGTVSSELCIRSSTGRNVSALFTTSDPGVKVQMCGLRIMYQEDLKGFVQAFIQCILHSSSNALFDYYNEMVVKQWLYLIKLPRSNEVGSVGKPCSRIESPTGMSPSSLRKYQSTYQDLRNRDWPVTQFSCSFPGIKIPRWFGHIYKSGFHATIREPWNLYDDENWLGIAVCGYFSVHKHPTDDTLVPEVGSTSRALVCDLLTNIDSVRLCGAELTNETMWLDSSGFTWLIYIPRVLFSSSLNQCDRICVTVTSSDPYVRAEECARRLVYKEDVEDLVQILTLCTLTSGSSPFFSSIVFENNQDMMSKPNPLPQDDTRFTRRSPRPTLLEISIAKFDMSSGLTWERKE